MIPEPLIQSVKQLRLSGILPSLPARAQQAQDGAMTPLEFLETILHDEVEQRKDRVLRRRLKKAQINPQFRLDSFDWKFNPKIPKSQICELATTQFIAKHENAIFIGPPGLGKSHLAHSLALAAIQAGYSALCCPVFEILEQLTEATATGERKVFFDRMLKLDLLILEDLGMKRMSVDMAEDLLELMMRRYEKASTVMTSNRPMEDWPKIFGDAATTSALLDRLMHHAHLIQFTGKSYRLHQSVLDQKNRSE